MNVSASVLVHGSAIHSLFLSLPIKKHFIRIDQFHVLKWDTLLRYFCESFIGIKSNRCKVKFIVITLSLPDPLPTSFTPVLKVMLESQCLRLKIGVAFDSSASAVPATICQLHRPLTQSSLQTCVLLPASQLACLVLISSFSKYPACYFLEQGFTLILFLGTSSDFHVQVTLLRLWLFFPYCS